MDDYIDKHITCHRPKKEENSEVGDQTDAPTFTYMQKGKKNKCRFNFPIPPMRKTQILEPLQPGVDEVDMDRITYLWTKIRKVLEDMKMGEQITMDEFLERLDVSEEDYILAVRSSIKEDTVFLKRTPWEIRVNAYNRDLLLATRANMDIQYVMNVYACAKYIASYLTKGQRGMSELLRKACAEVQTGNMVIRQQMRHIANKFINAVEISAQEAAYLLLQLPLRKSLRQVVSCEHKYAW